MTHFSDVAIGIIGYALLGIIMILVHWFRDYRHEREPVKTFLLIFVIFFVVMLSMCIGIVTYTEITRT